MSKGVFIKDMEYPMTCYECPFFLMEIHQYRLHAWCAITKEEDEIVNQTPASLNKRMDNCPLMALPFQHGDLIDRKELQNDLFIAVDGTPIPFRNCDNFPIEIEYKRLWDIIAMQETVIEREKE